jgi:hypothetical protein
LLSLGEADGRSIQKQVRVCLDQAGEKRVLRQRQIRRALTGSKLPWLRIMADEADSHRVEDNVHIPPNLPRDTIKQSADAKPHRLMPGGSCELLK